MKLDICVAGASRDEGQISCVGGAGMVLTFTDKDDRIQRREFYFSLGGSGQLLAEIQAARLALASVAPMFRLYPTVLYTTSLGLAGILTDKISQSTFTAQIAELLRWYGYYKNIAAEVVSDSELLSLATRLAHTGLESQKHHDSLTYRVSHV
jgi:hypothetical protein